MSRGLEVFHLADDDAEDYLNFGSSKDYSIEQKEETPTKGRATAKSRKPSNSTNTQDVYDVYEKAPRARIRDLRETMYPSESQDGTQEYNDEPSSKKIPPKQVAEHQTLLMCLQRYNLSERFGPMCKTAGLKLTNLEGKTVAELKQLQTRVRTVCSSSGSNTGMLYQGILTGASVFEKMVPKRVADLEGYQASLRTDPEFEAIAEMLELDMGFASNMTPMQRMGLCLAKNAANVAAMNKTKNRVIDTLRAQQQQQPTQTQQTPTSSATTNPLPPPPNTQPSDFTENVQHVKTPVYD